MKYSFTQEDIDKAKEWTALHPEMTFCGKAGNKTIFRSSKGLPWHIILDNDYDKHYSYHSLSSALAICQYFI